DLPVHAEAVHAPAALFSLGYRGELRPESIDLGLVLAGDLEREAGTEIELVLGAAVHRSEDLAGEREVGEGHRAGPLRIREAVADRRVLDEPGVEVDRRLGARLGAREEQVGDEE